MFAAIGLCGLSPGTVGAVDHSVAVTLCFGVVGVCLSVTQVDGPDASIAGGAGGLPQRYSAAMTLERPPC